MIDVLVLVLRERGQGDEQQHRPREYAKRSGYRAGAHDTTTSRNMPAAM